MKELMLIIVGSALVNNVVLSVRSWAFPKKQKPQQAWEEP